MPHDLHSSAVRTRMRGHVGGKLWEFVACKYRELHMKASSETSHERARARTSGCTLSCAPRLHAVSIPRAVSESPEVILRRVSYTCPNGSAFLEGRNRVRSWTLKRNRAAIGTQVVHATKCDVTSHTSARRKASSAGARVLRNSTRTVALTPFSDCGCC